MQSRATTVATYLQELPEDRREAIEAVREVILANLPLPLIGEAIASMGVDEYVDLVKKLQSNRRGKGKHSC